MLVEENWSAIFFPQVWFYVYVVSSQDPRESIQFNFGFPSELLELLQNVYIILRLLSLTENTYMCMAKM